MQYILINSNVVLFNPRALWANPGTSRGSLFCARQSRDCVARNTLYRYSYTNKKIFVEFVDNNVYIQHK